VLQQHALAELLVADAPVSTPHRGFAAIVGQDQALRRFLALIRAAGQALILRLLGQQRIGRTQRVGRRARPCRRPRQCDHPRLNGVALDGAPEQTQEGVTVLVAGEVRLAVVAPVHHVAARHARPLPERGMRGIVFSFSLVRSKPAGQKSPILLHTPLLARSCVERHHFPSPVSTPKAPELTVAGCRRISSRNTSSSLLVKAPWPLIGGSISV
jgi:hypothetical protein